MTKRILIVDDDLESLKLIGLMLQRRGYEIITAHAGSQALVKARDEVPDLVILDIMMPDMDGYDVCRKLRADPETAYIPILMFTAKTLVGDKVDGFRAGADDYLTKPIHPSELVAHVEALLERSEKAQADVVRRPRTRIVGVMGAKGGVGVSTLVINLAAASVKVAAVEGARDAGHKVGVLDMRAGLGTVALQLGQMPEQGWANLLERNADTLDRETVAGQLVTHPSGLRFLPAPLQPTNGLSSLPPDHVEAVLDRLTGTVDVLYLDLGCVLDAATRRALSRCDVLLVVAEPERLCLILARALLDRIQALDRNPDELRVVLVQRGETQPSYSQEEVEALLGHRPSGLIEPAGLYVRQALEKGEPLVLSYPESEVAEQYLGLHRALFS